MLTPREEDLPEEWLGVLGVGSRTIHHTFWVEQVMVFADPSQFGHFSCASTITNKHPRSELRISVAC